MKIDLVKIVACPDCGGELTEIVASGNELVGFCCQTCGIVFPVTDGIPILLPERARNHRLEYGLVENMKRIKAEYILKDLDRFIQKTLNLLDQNKNAPSWEWEDEKHWTKIYDKRIITPSIQNWNDRVWQREFLARHLVSQTSLKGKTILDVGAGEGQSFRSLLLKHCDEETLYIALDISLSGLKLNRLRNPHDNSVYILCSADYIPVQKQIVDILCYFGVLHHTERKEQNIRSNKKLVKENGYILLHEPLSRPSPALGPLKFEDEESAHEERIDKRALMTTITENSLEIVASRYLHTIFFTGVMRFFGSNIVKSKLLFRILSGVDKICMIILGSVISYFKAGATLQLLRKV